ncbi:MAG TPA: hypothetical protein VFZ17_11540 [Acidimicrobiia bacterium]|nr:hypothetical protein [Acidimicrobiia bacterium]
MQAAGSRSDAVVLARRGLWVVLPLGCAVWVLAISTHYYPVWDEWDMVNRATSISPLRALFIGFNGHMWSLASAAYDVQVRLLGLQSNWLLPLAMVASLAALQLSAAAVLVRLRVPSVVALLAATVVTFFGPGSEEMVYQNLFPHNFAIAFSLAAAFVALGARRDRTTAVVVAALSIAALPCDSAFALGALFFTATLVLVLWPFRLAVIALVPPLVGNVVWFFFDRSQVIVPSGCPRCDLTTVAAPLGDRVGFARAILVRSAGGLVGGGATAGAIVIVVGAALVVLAVVLRCLSRPVVAGLVGGVVAALALAASIGWSRAGYWPSLDEAITALQAPSNRYVRPAAIFLMLAIVPVATALARTTSARTATVIGVVASVGLVAVFVVNLGDVRETHDFYVSWGDNVEQDFRETVTVITEGCPPGTRLDEHAEPLQLSFQASVPLVRDLVDRGAVPRDFGRPPSEATLARLCRGS